MNALNEDPDDDQLAALLVDFEIQLAAGHRSSASIIDTLPTDSETSRQRLLEAKECLLLLEEIWPHAQPLGDELPTSIGRFPIVRELGRGGFSIVYLARDEQLGRDIALKVQRPEAITSSTLRDRFLREAKASARLRHPHIACVHEVGDAGLQIWIASECIAGDSLAAWLRTNPAPVASCAAAAFLASLADAVEYAHYSGVLHRDLKPSNVLLESTMPNEQSSTDLAAYKPKLIDFGLAKLEDAQQLETRSGALIGTPPYMSPEQAAGNVRQVGPATDVYGLGTILYELLTRRAVFGGENDVQTLRQVIEDEPVRPRKIRATLPVDLEAITLKCLEKRPADRYRTAGDLATDLRRFLAGEPTLARPLGARERMIKWARRRPALAALIAVCGLAAVLLLSGGALHTVQIGRAFAASEQSRLEALAASDRAEMQRQQAEDSRSEAIRERDVSDQYRYAAEMHQAFQVLSQGNVQEVAALLAEYDDGQRGAGLRGFEWYYLRHSLDGSRQVLRGHKGEVYSVAYSPDGRLLVSGGEDGTIRVWDPANGQELHTIDAHTSCTNNLDFSPNGQLLASSSCDGTVKLWDTGTWQVVHVFTGHGHPVMGVAFSPDGKLVASGDDAYRLRVWDVLGASEVVAMYIPRSFNALAWTPDGEQLLVAAQDELLHIETKTWKSLGKEECKSQSEAFAISPDGRRLAVNLFHTIEVRDASSGATLEILSGHHDSIQRIAFSPDGRRLYSGGADRLVKVWMLKTEDSATMPSDDRSRQRPKVPALIGHTARVQDLAVAPDGRMLATASFDNTVRLWDLAATEGSAPISVGDVRFDHYFVREPVAFSPDCKSMVALGSDQRITFSDLGGVRKTSDETIPLGTNDKFYMAPNGENYCIWDAESRRLSFASITNPSTAMTLGTPVDKLYELEFSADGRSAAFASSDGLVHVCDTSTGNERLAVDVLYPDAARSLEFAPNARPALSKCGRMLALMSTESKNVLIDLESGARTALPQTETAVSSISFSPDDRLLVARCYTGDVYLIDAGSGHLLRTIRMPSEAVTCSPDCRTLAIATEGEVTLCHIATGHEIARLSIAPPTATPYKLQFSTDGGALTAVVLGDTATAGTQSAVVYLWDIRDDCGRR